MINWSKYTWIALTSSRSNLAYLSEVTIRTIFLGVILYIFLQLWRLTYAETGSQQLGGLTLSQMIWYLAIAESIMLSGPRVAQEVDEDVRTGMLAVQLIRPLSYPCYQLWKTFGERTVRFGLNATVGALIARLFVGPINLTLDGLAMFLFALVLSFLLDFLGVFLVGLGAFWMENTTGLMLIYSRMCMVLGGKLIPLELFPDYLQPLFKSLPFSSIVYGPARLFVHPNLAFFGELMLRQIISILVLALCVSLVYSMAVRRIHVNGG